MESDKSKRNNDETFSDEAARARLDAALRGATNKPRTQMKDIPRQRPYTPRKRKRATEPKSGEPS